MKNLDLKHIIAAIVGIVLGIIANKYSVDFSNVCPAAPVPAASPAK